MDFTSFQPTVHRKCSSLKVGVATRILPTSHSGDMKNERDDVTFATSLLLQEFSKAKKKPCAHSDSGTIEILMLTIGHLFVRSLVRSHRSLVRLLRTARFARALRSAHSFARSLTSSRARGTVEYFCLFFKVSWITVQGVNHCTGATLRYVDSNHVYSADEFNSFFMNG